MRKPYRILLLLLLACQLAIFPALSLADEERPEDEPYIAYDSKQLETYLGNGFDVLLGGSFAVSNPLIVNSVLDLDGHTLSGNTLTINGTVQNGALNFNRIHLGEGKNHLDRCSTGSSSLCHLIPISVPIPGKVICITGYGSDGQLISDDPDDNKDGRFWTVVAENSITLIIVQSTSLGTVWYDMTSGSPAELSWDITYQNVAGKELSGLTPSTYKTSETSETGMKLAETYTDEKGNIYKIDSYIDPPDGIIPAQTSGAILVTVGEVSKAESRGQGGSGGLSPGGFSGGGRSGGVSGLNGASAMSEDGTDDSEAEGSDSVRKASSGGVLTASVATASSFLGSGGGRRLASANSSVKSSLSQELPVMDLSEVSARFDASKKSEKHLSWEIIAAGGLILIGLVVLVLLIRKNSQERTAEIYEKLHIQR